MACIRFRMPVRGCADHSFWRVGLAPTGVPIEVAAGDVARFYLRVGKRATMDQVLDCFDKRNPVAKELSGKIEIFTPAELRELVTPQDAKEWFKITPEAVEKQKAESRNRRRGRS